MQTPLSSVCNHYKTLVATKLAYSLAVLTAGFWCTQSDLIKNSVRHVSLVSNTEIDAAHLKLKTQSGK